MHHEPVFASRGVALRGLMSFALTGFAIVGCGPQAPALKTAPVAGTVTYNGNAVEGAQVVFSPVNKNDRSAVGTTDASGRFTVQTPVGGEKMAKGALAGDYSVVVVKNLSAAAAVDMKSGTPEENVKKAEEMMRKTPGAVGE